MFLIKIFHFLKGYVILSIKGHNKEEFISRIAKSRIKIFDTKAQGDEIIIKILATDFLRIKSLYPKCRIRILKKCGLGFYLKGMRKTFVIGFLLFFILIGLSSLFIWDIEYEGAENIDKAQLVSATRLAGLKRGMLKAHLKSGYEMKDIILNNTDGVCWAWVYVKGTRVTVKVRENIIPPQVFDPDIPCDIVAARSGIIKSVTTIRGRCLAEENQAVAPGDTIISGTYQFENEPGYQVHSSGSVKAQTEHIKSGVYTQNYCYKKYTGRKRRKITLCLFGKEIPLYLKENPGFSVYDQDEVRHDLKIGEFYPGYSITVKTAREYIEEKEPISLESTVDFAQKELEAQIAEELFFGAELLDKKCETERIDEETVKVTVIMNFMEEIGTEKRIDEVTVIEPKTDRASGWD